VIVTLTLNPSLDRTVEVPALARGSVIRVSSARLDPGGKGVNVARALLANGVEARAVLPVGGPAGHQLVELLDGEGVAMSAVRVAAATRSNLTLSEPDGTVTKINEAGEPLAAREIEQLADAVTGLAGPGDWAVLSGSVPPGVDDDVYAHLIRRFTEAGIEVAVDTSGPALMHAVDAGPALVKPNHDEVGAALGRQVRSIADAVAAAERVRKAGARAVLVSLGPDGAVLAEEGAVWRGDCPVAERRSTVGAGDCLLAGFLAAGGAGSEALATALRWAAAAVERPGSGVPGPEDIAGRRAHVTDQIDDDRALTMPG
jgi:1-phosphofructokinase